MSDVVIDGVADAVRTRVEKTCGGPSAHLDEWNLKGLSEELSYLLMRPVAMADLEAGRYEELEEKTVAIGEAAYRARETEFSAAMMRELERWLYLGALDEHWRDHLYELDHLKSGIGLRAYGQRDPLIEYKKEAFALFETLLDEVREAFVQRLFRVQLAPDALRQAEPRPAPRQLVARHAEAEVFGGSALAGPEAGAESERVPAAPVRHSGSRVGRNDPCPCGSGKKYKKCHMAADEAVESRS